MIDNAWNSHMGTDKHVERGSHAPTDRDKDEHIWVGMFAFVNGGVILELHFKLSWTLKGFLLRWLNCRKSNVLTIDIETQTKNFSLRAARFSDILSSLSSLKCFIRSLQNKLFANLMKKSLFVIIQDHSGSDRAALLKKRQHLNWWQQMLMTLKMMEPTHISIAFIIRRQHWYTLGNSQNSLKNFEIVEVQFKAKSEMNNYW